MINVTATAEEYLSKLIAKKDFPCDIRIFVSDPGTPKAETCLAFCKENENQETDLKIKLSKFDLYIEERSVSYLDDAEVNYDKDNFGGQLTIKAPSARVPKIGDMRHSKIRLITFFTMRSTLNLPLMVVMFI